MELSGFLELSFISATSGQIPEWLGDFCSEAVSGDIAHKLLEPQFQDQLGLLRDGLIQIFGGENESVKRFLETNNFISFIALMGTLYKP